MSADRLCALLGALLGLSGVALGAFGAHGLRARLGQEWLTIFEVGVRYQMYHALALFAVAWAMQRWPSTALLIAGWLFLAGVIVFSGSLYALALTTTRAWGAVTPVGGVLLIAGWACLAWGIVSAPR